jgi:hypothetical protein
LGSKEERGIGLQVDMHAVRNVWLLCRIICITSLTHACMPVCCCFGCCCCCCCCLLLLLVSPSQLVERNLWSVYPPEEEDEEERQLREQRVRHSRPLSTPLYTHPPHQRVGCHP